MIILLATYENNNKVGLLDNIDIHPMEFSTHVPVSYTHLVCHSFIDNWILQNKLFPLLLCSF